MREVIEICKRYEYVSFDIFDTLILRCVAKPNDVFQLVACRYNILYPENKQIDNFVKKRINCECIVRKENSREITLDEIYYELEKKENDIVCEKYKEIEKYIEYVVCNANLYYRNLFEECIKIGKKVLITSDMYLPEEVIISILKKNGIKGYHKLYVSSSRGFTKHEGSLYRYILEDCGTQAEKMIHIGDNWKSDIIQARKLGIKTIRVRKDKKERNKKIEVRTLNTFFKNTLQELNSSSEIFGYRYLGPMLYGYARWLDENFAKENYDCILFFSREGDYIKKAYEEIRELSNPRRMYFYASRRALQIPAIWTNPNYTEVMSDMFLPYNFSVSWLVEHWGLNIENCREEIKNIGLKLEDRFSKFTVLSDQKVQNLYYRLKEKIVKNSKQEFDSFVEYLKNNRIYGKVAIVDIGWNGNMQKAFLKNVSKVEWNIDVTGYYLGYHTTSSNYREQYMKGYLKDKNTLSADFLIDLYAETAIELLFMAQHGSVLKYVENDHVMFSEFEYNNTDTYFKVNEIQKFAILFLRDFKDIGKCLPNSSDVYADNLLKMFKKPTLQEVDFIGSMMAWDKEWIPMAMPKHISEYFFHPSLLKEDLLHNSWKIGFIKKVLRIPFPYHMCLKIIRRSALIAKDRK